MKVCHFSWPSGINCDCYSAEQDRQKKKEEERKENPQAELTGADGEPHTPAQLSRQAQQQSSNRTTEKEMYQGAA